MAPAPEETAPCREALGVAVIAGALKGVETPKRDSLAAPPVVPLLQPMLKKWPVGQESIPQKGVTLFSA